MSICYCNGQGWGFLSAGKRIQLPRLGSAIVSAHAENENRDDRFYTFVIQAEDTRPYRSLQPHGSRHTANTGLAQRRVLRHACRTSQGLNLLNITVANSKRMLLAFLQVWAALRGLETPTPARRRTEREVEAARATHDHTRHAVEENSGSARGIRRLLEKICEADSPRPEPFAPVAQAPHRRDLRSSRTCRR